MSRSAETIIVGGGFAGLLMASGIPESLVFEENTRVGIPPHCTGLVSEGTVSLIGSPAKESITSKYRVIRVVRLRGGEILSLIPDQSVVRLDRILLEEIMAREAENRGSKIYTKTRALSITDSDTAVSEKDGVKRYKGSLIAIAEGSQQRFSRSLGLAEKPEIFVGVQGFAKISSYVDEEEIYVFVDDDLFRGFFGWLVPLDSRKAVVGIASHLKDYAYGKLGLVVRILFRRGILLESSLSSMYGGLVIRGSPFKNHHTGSIVAIGDASNFTKPFSGGGLYPSSIQIRTLVSRLKRHDPRDALTKYSRDINAYVNSLRQQLAITRIAEKLGIEKTLLRLTRIGVLNNTETFSYDHHDQSLYKKLRKLPEAFIKR